MTPEHTTAPALPLHPQAEMECRRCEVHCDKVVYPGACLARACPFVYSFPYDDYNNQDGFLACTHGTEMDITWCPGDP